MGRLVPILLLAAACGGAGTGPDAGTVDIADAGIDAAPADPRFDDGEHSGVVQLLELHSAWGAAGIAQAAYLEAPTRMRFVHYAQIVVVHPQVEVMREGSCRLLEPQAPFCTDCTGICVAAEVCEPLPVYVSAGTLEFTGMTVPLSLAHGQYWYSSQGSVPADAFADDATIEVSAPGEAFPAHELALDGVPPLVTDLGADPLVLTDGADTTIRWTPAGAGARVHLMLNANNMGHGMPYTAIIECEGDDTGELTVPRALIEAFPAVDGNLPGCEGSDCPASLLTRYRSVSTDVGALDRVRFTLGSQRQFTLVHE
jgi:hypothetical protein